MNDPERESNRIGARSGLLDQLTSQISVWKPSLSPEQELVYEFLEGRELDSARPEDLFERFEQSEQYSSTPELVMTEAEFRDVVDDLVAAGHVDIDYRVSTDP